MRNGQTNERRFNNIMQKLFYNQNLIDNNIKDRKNNEYFMKHPY